MSMRVSEQYQAGKNYNNKLPVSYYDLCETNWAFYRGDQWINSNAKDELPRPVFNIINKIIMFFVASLTSTAAKCEFSAVAGDENAVDFEILNQQFAEWWECNKMDFKLKDLYIDGAVTGDFCLHMYVDPEKKPFDGMYSEPFNVLNDMGEEETIEAIGEIVAEILDGTQVYFGNPNITDVQKQPYILITGRDTVANLKREAKQNRDEIKSDDSEDDNGSSLFDIELDSIGDDNDKATYIYKYEKKKGKVFVSKYVGEVEIIKETDTGFKYYPIAWGNWEKQKGSYHGRALVTSVVPNQIFINRMMAMSMYNLQMTAFPKLVYDRQRVGSLSNQIGAMVGVDNLAGQSIGNAITYLAPGQMSSQIVQIINMAMDFTKDVLGANSALLGNVNPEQASGAAITVAARQSAVPLENPKNEMYSFLEDVARIYVDMAANTYGTRPISADVDGERQIVQYDFSVWQKMFPKVSVDVGPTTYYSEIARVQTLDNWLAAGYIDFIKYLEMMPDGYMASIDKLLNELKEQQAQVAEQAAPRDTDALIAQLPPDVQKQFMALPPEQQQAMLAEFIG